MKMARRAARKPSELMGIKDEWVAFAWDFVLEVIDRDQTRRAISRDTRRRGRDGQPEMRFPVYDMTDLLRWG